MTTNEVREYVDSLTALARRLNTFTGGLKAVRAEQPKMKPSAAVREPVAEYLTTDLEEISRSTLF